MTAVAIADAAVPPAPAVAAREASRVGVFDAVRFACALTVVLYHYTADGRWPALAVVAHHGYLGVDVFFILSGFFITMTAEGRGAGDFARARAVRLLPAYWVCCGATFIAVRALGDGASLADLARNLLLMPTLLGGTYLDGVYWTLSCELLFYTLVWLVLLARQWRHAERIAYAWLAAVALATLAVPGHRLWTVITIKGYAQYFIAGSILCLVMQRGATPRRLLALGLAYVLACAHMPIRPETAGGPMAGACVIIAVAFLVLGAIAWRPPRFASPLLALSGAISYPLYLIHQRVGLLAMAALFPRVGPGVVAGATLAAVAVAATIHLAVERPLQRVLRGALGGRRLRPPAPPALAAVAGQRAV